MKLYMKQKVFSLKQDFEIYDENKQAYFRVDGQLLSIGRKMRIFDARTEEEVAFIKEIVLTLFAKMEVYRQDELVAVIKQKFSFLRPKFEIEEIGWHIEGDFWGYNYAILDTNGATVASIQKKILSWSDTYEFEINDDKDTVTVMAVILAIDAIRDRKG